MDSDVIMAYADELNPQLWRSSVPLIFYAIVEMHRPERVVRQFGMRQNVPESMDTQDMSLHQISRKNHAGRRLVSATHTIYHKMVKTI